jgi:hypothetical protein
MLMHAGAAQRARTDPAAAERQRLGVAPTGAIAVGPAAAAPTVVAPGFAPPRPTGAIVLPGLAPPAEPVNNTMRIATPVGYSSRPPRKMWPIVLVISLVLGLGAGSFAVAWCGQGDSGGNQVVADGSDDAAGSAAGDGSGSAVAGGGSGSAATGGGSGTAVAGGGSGSGAAGGGSGTVEAGSGSGSGSAAAAPERANLTIESLPPGASVYSAAGELLGKTPLKLDWQISAVPATFELRLVGHRRRTKEVVVSGNTTVRIELERLPPPTRPSGPGSGSVRNWDGSGDSGLMRPK